MLSSAPYGYHYQKSTEKEEAAFIVNPAEAAVVKEAFELYALKGWSLGKIAKYFTQGGYATRKNKARWENSVVWGMLHNPAYKGTAAFRKITHLWRASRSHGSTGRIGLECD